MSMTQPTHGWRAEGSVNDCKSRAEGSPTQFVNGMNNGFKWLPADWAKGKGDTSPNP